MEGQAPAYDESVNYAPHGGVLYPDGSADAGVYTGAPPVPFSDAGLHAGAYAPDAYGMAGVPPAPMQQPPLDTAGAASYQVVGVGVEAPPLQVARPAGNLLLIPLCRKGDRAGIERQLQGGAAVGETDQEGNTPLHVAVEAPRNEIATVQCLLEHSANVNAVNYIGATPLHYVCLRKTNHRGVTNILLENGSNINCQTVAGKSPLHFACELELPELVEMLCLFGADTNLLDAEGCMPIHLVLSKEGGRDTVKRQILDLLVQYQSQLLRPDCSGVTPLHLACKSGHLRCVQCLLDHQAPVDVVTAKGQTGLHLACLGGHAEVVQLLINRSAQLIDVPDLEGNTALHLCALVGSLDCAMLLLKWQANTTLKNNQKKTALDLSKIRGTDLSSTHNPELMQVLKDANKGGSCRQQ